MKDENKEIIVVEFIGLRAQMNAFFILKDIVDQDELSVTNLTKNAKPTNHYN